MLYSALIGKPTEHSISHILFEELARVANIADDYKHLKIDVEEDHLEPALHSLQELGFKGLNVTLPYKIDVMQYLDKIDEAALAIGAVNTIQIRDTLIGFNTDWLGIYTPLAKRFKKRPPSNITIFGSGGAARAAVYAARKLGANNIHILYRDENQAEELRKLYADTNDAVITLSTYDSATLSIQKSQLIINASSAGMTGKDDTPIEFKILRGIDLSEKTYFDVVFKPLHTPLLNFFEKNGAFTIDGLWMMIYQAVKALSIWTGRELEIPYATLQKIHVQLKHSLSDAPKHILGINFDEISDDLDEALSLMKELDIRHGELRTINGKNFVSWTDEEVQTFKEQMKQHDLSLVAAATPLFKWYVNTDDAEISHDSFGFNPRLSDAEKKAVIKRTIVIASELSIPRLRIFSGLGTATKDSAKEFASSPLLGYALRLADEYGVDLYIENEPVCRIHTKQAILELLNTNQHPRLKLWLDIANLLELGEKIDDAFITAVAPRLGYIHIKDFKDLATNKLYVPVGEGDIDYSSIISKIFNLCPDSDLIFTVETHAKKDKLRGSRISLINTASIIKSQEK